MTVNARVYVETASLHPTDCDDVLDRHPFLRKRLERYAELRQDVEMMVRTSFSDSSVLVRTYVSLHLDQYANLVQTDHGW